MLELRRIESGSLTDRELLLIRSLVDGAFGARFSDHDWEHALGGTHVVLESDGVPLSHASVVPRVLHIGDDALRVGYVEAVATQAVCRRQGYAAKVMTDINAVIQASYDLGALSTGVHEFYVRLGWERWRGPTFAEMPTGRVRTADEDDGILILRTARTTDVDPTAGLMCDYRGGDVW